MGGLTRRDLGILGGSYLILSGIKISGIYALGINIVLLILLKLSKRYLKPGLFQLLLSRRQLCWAYCLEKIKIKDTDV